LKDLSVFYDITEPMQTFTWIQASEKMAWKDIIKSLVTKRNNEVRYPKFSKIQKVVEGYLKVTEGYKWEILRNIHNIKGKIIK